MRRPTGRDMGGFWAGLRSPQRVSVVRATFDGALVAWKLKRRGLRPLIRATPSAATTADAERAARVAEAVDAGLAVLPLSPTCLRRSVTLLRELDRLGLAATMHIGVRSVASAIEAHAWVQVGEVVVNDDPALVATYAELAVEEIGRLPEGLEGLR